jgi:hypothetical protein
LAGRSNVYAYAADPVGAAASRETGTFAATFTPDHPPVSKQCLARPLRDGKKHGGMVGATPPTLHALPCEGVRKDAEGEYPNRNTGGSKPIGAEKSAGRRPRQKDNEETQ